MAMKRGFLNTPRYKRAIEEAYEPQSSPGPDPSRQGKSASPPRPTQDGGDKAGVAEGTMGAEKITILPSLDADSHNDATAKTPTKKLDADPKGKGKGKAKVVDPDGDAMNTSANGLSSMKVCLERIPPRRRGWGRDPREDVLHTIPESHGDLHKKRAIFCAWPRSPNGKPIMPGQHVGTLSPDGYPWAATLYDLYAVNRVPSVHGAISYMTGSTLLHAMKALKEFDAAGSEIEWASSEGKPRDEGVADTEELIHCMENQIQLMGHLGFSVSNGSGSGFTILQEECVEQASQYDSDGERNDDMNVPVDPVSPPRPDIPITSPFHPSHYPKPWPLIPFEKTLPVLLQERIPLYLLPQTLHVHDPFNLLSAREPNFSNTSWNSRPDIIRTYNLKFSESVLKGTEEARKKAEELEEFKARTLIILRYKRTKEQIKNYEPMIEVPLPPYPRRTTRTEEGHLYLSPIAKVGDGNHSIVYKAEWELPRDLFVRPKICPECFKESADKETQRLKDTGRWEKLLRAASWGLTGFTGRQPTEVELREASDPINLAKDGETIEREIICTVPPSTPPSQILDRVDECEVWEMLMNKKDVNRAVLDFTETLPADDKDSKEGPQSHVAGIRINPPFSYGSQKTCTHRSCNMPFNTPFTASPRTVLLTVIAKLSLEHDPHLAREAINYQNFPEHFFHHYSGYTIINQLRAVVPVHAIVPQFYGYYTPQKATSEKEKQKGGYLSPILLLEHCGAPVDPETLSHEDQEECVSMVLRFQKAGWLHESLAPRNFLVQIGKPTEFPLQREVSRDLSFRLIDFGRSRKYQQADEKRAEEMVAMEMFGVGWQMAVTLAI